jgi:hypothetical protein
LHSVAADVVSVPLLPEEPTHAPTTASVLYGDQTRNVALEHAPAGKTGPAAVAFMSAGAAAGYSWLRRKRKKS